MGLFDSITIKDYNLPQPPAEEIKYYTPETEFQTKDLNEGMGEWKIDGAGYLWEKRTKWTYPEPPPNPKSFLDSYVYPEQVSSSWEQSFITSTLNIYTSQWDEIGDHDYWIEYDIVFIKGRVAEVKLIKFTSTNNLARKEKYKQFEIELQESYAFRQSFGYRYFYQWYFKGAKRTFRVINKFLDNLEKSLWNLERKIT